MSEDIYDDYRTMVTGVSLKGLKFKSCLFQNWSGVGRLVKYRPKNRVFRQKVLPEVSVYTKKELKNT